MLSCRNLDVRPRPDAPPLVRGATAQFAAGGLHAIIGPSGCGKTTLFKGVLGILPAEGGIFLRGQRVTDHDPLRRELAFAPQFSIAHGKLTVGESLAYALKLYRGLAGAVGEARIAELLQLVGLGDRRGALVEKLSGGQLRRLGLALELTTDPACLLCDEVTSGLDPRSEDQILAVLRTLVAEQAKTVVCVIHNLAKLPQFDTVTVVHEGAVVFQGTLPDLLGHFDLADALTLYDRLNEEPPEHWRQRWAEIAPAWPNDKTHRTANRAPPARTETSTPSVLAQTLTLLARRWQLLWRDRGYLGLTLAITFGFPCLVVIFALNGLPQLKMLALDQSAEGTFEAMLAKTEFVRDALKTGTLVSGLIIFQVILLCLMGSNNGAREIAGERALYEKERMSGLRPAAYALAKITFAALLGAAQGAWMTMFVKGLCQFPGSWGEQMLVLGGTCAAMSVVCLGLSAWFISADKASLLSIYLVGFQLPLSGVVLALPAAIVWLVRPLIVTYWGWIGYLKAMGDVPAPHLYDAVILMGADKGWWFAPTTGALAVLAGHFLVGAALVFWGCQKKRWP
ncbi:MAG: ATP-binding cassette domain-containing protein [Verrucomicrobiota bacterium]